MAWQVNIGVIQRAMEGQLIEAYRDRLVERQRRLIAELFIPCGKPEVSGETAKEQNSEMLEIAALHRDNPK